MTAVLPSRPAPAAAPPVTAPAPPAPGLVRPPDDEELYWYLGAEKRWLPVCMTVAFVLAGISVYKFSLRGPALYAFIVVLGINVVGAVVAVMTSVARRRDSVESHRRKIATWDPPVLPSVDVFLPTCGEGLDILANTYHYVSAMRWDGRKRVLVLDDAARPEVADLAATYGFEYVVRPNRGEMKKAGNMRHAYGLSDGDVIAVFDADFCPREDYLWHLMPYLDDPTIGIVQSPQTFDTRADMSWLERTAGATQEYFYRFIQPSRDRFKAAICVGTNALYRRAALDTVGGFAQIEHSEDVHTGMKLMRQGYDLRYVPINVAKGVCPDDLAAFVNQQYRWCAGSMSLLTSGVTMRKPLDRNQKLCFWSGFIYYISTALNVFAVHLPGLIMAFCYPSEVRAYHYLPFLFGVWLYFVLLPRSFKSRYRFEVLRVQITYSFAHAVAIADALRRRHASWTPTGAVKGGNRLARRICRLAFGWLSIVTVASWVGFFYAVSKYGLENFWPMALFLTGYTYLAIPLVRDAGRVLVRDRRARRSAANVTKPTVTATTGGSR